MPEISLSVDVDAPAEQTWAAATDWAGQRAWMLGTDVRVTGPDTVEAATRLGPLRFVDPMRITTWDPPRRCVVRHLGAVVRGSAAFEVEPLPDGRSRFVWTEWLVLPLGLIGELGFALARPFVLAGLRYSLGRFARWAATRPLLF